MMKRCLGFLAVACLTSMAVAQTTPVGPASGTVTPLPAIHVAQNGRYFEKADGTPFFWLGDTAWCIFNHASPADVDLYLNDRASKGFTVIQGCVAVWDFSTRANPDGLITFNDVPRGRGRGAGAPGQTPATASAPTTAVAAGPMPTVNEAYFKNVDAIVDKCTQRGMYMAILPFWTKNTRSGPFNDPAVMGPYCEFLGRHFAKKNVFFVLGGDTGADPAILPAIEAEAQGLLKGAKEAGVDKIMITYHPTGRQSSSFWYQEKPWLDFNAIQSGHFINTTNFQIVAGDFAKLPVKPTLDMEPGYENITDNLVRTNVDNTTPRIQAVDVRRSAYLAVFAGAAGHTYGNGEVYEFYAGGAPTGNAGWHADMNWKDALKLPAAGQVQYLRYLIESRPMLERVPDQRLIVGGPPALPSSGASVPATGSGPATATGGGGRGRGPRVSVLDRLEATRGSSGDYAFVYLPAGQMKVTVNTGMLSGNALTAWWYDPRTGKAAKVDTTDKGATREYTIPTDANVPAGQADWVLVLDDAAKGFGEPGKH